MITHKLLYPIAVIGLLIVTMMIYKPGLFGSTIFDDHEVIFNNPAITAIEGLNIRQILTATESTSTGALKRPVSMLTFAINYALTGDNPLYFKLTGLIIHLLSGISLGYFTWLFFGQYSSQYAIEISPIRRYWLSIAVTAAWLLHPFNLTTVLYIVQRMTSLSALFSIWGMIFYLQGRQKIIKCKHLASGWIYIFFAVPLCGLLAVFSKENGALLLFYLLLIEAVLFNFHCKNAKNRRLLVLLCASSVLLICLLGLSFLGAFRSGGLSAAYINRPFELHERVLTEGRVLLFYLKLLVLPNVNEMGLFHDDFSLSTSFFSPPSTLFSWVIWGALVLISIAWRRKAPLIGFGIGFYIIGHSMESSIIALELIHEHRNYLPGYGILLALMYYMAHPALRNFLGFRSDYIFTGLFLFALAFSTAYRASNWSSAYTLYQNNWNNHPQCSRSNIVLGKYLLGKAEILSKKSNTRQEVLKLRHFSRQIFEHVLQIDNFHLNGHFLILMLDEIEHKNTDLKLYQQLKNRLQMPPLSTNTLSVFFGLNEDRILKHKGLSAQMLSSLGDSILKNPALNGHRKARMFAESAALASYQNDILKAQNLIQEAIRRNPNEPSFHAIRKEILLKDSAQRNNLKKP